MTKPIIPAEPLADLDHPGFSISRRGLAVGAAALFLPARAFSQAPAAAPADSAIVVDRARTDPIPVAIPPLTGSDGDAAKLGRDIAGVITNNLSRCGLFRAIDPAAFIGGPDGDVPNFNNWKGIGAQALVTGKVDPAGPGKIRVEFRLWDVLQARRSKVPPTPPIW